MNSPSVLARLGFDPGRLRFALTTAVAAALALLLATAIGLEHPQWSAMTVWAASQPSRGQLLEKSFFRVAGTVSGTFAGIFLVWISVGHPWILVAGLAVWLGLCAGIGNVQRGFVSYGTMLAGYSAAMVSLLDTAHPDHVVGLGVDRLTTVLVGVGIALVVGGIFAARGGEDEVAARARRLSARLLADLAAHLRGVARPRGEEQRRILSEMAAIEDGLEPHGAGSMRSRRVVRAIRSLLIAEVAGLLWLRRDRRGAPAPEVAAALASASAALAAASPPAEVDRAMNEALTAARADPPLADMIAGLAAALAQRPQDAAAPVDRLRASVPVVLHRDWVGAREALIRAFVTMALVGGAWVATGLAVGPFLLLGTAVMTSLFSTFDNPARFMGNVLAGQILGAAGALACRWLVWPHVSGDLVSGDLGLALAMVPFILLGVPIFAHRRTMAVSFDYNMVMPLLLQPAYPPTLGFSQSLAQAAAIAAAPVMAFIAYRLVFPVDSARRMETLIEMMVHEVVGMASATDAPEQRRVWRARLYYRLLRLVRWAEKSGERGLAVTEGCLALLDLGSAVIRLRELSRLADLPPGALRGIDLVTRRMAELGRRPERVARALDLAAARFDAVAPRDAERFRAAARAVEADRAFFLRAAGRG